MRILVTGAGGLLGGRLCRLLSDRYPVTALVRSQAAPEGIPSLVADLADEQAVETSLRRARPAVVVHAAALADPEACEREPSLARRENETAARLLASACARHDARLILISTDLVFDGEGAPYGENARVAPLMAYGRSKAQGEAAAVRERPESVILRVALLCGTGHGSKLTASEAIAARLRRGEGVTLFEDEWRTPIDPGSVADAVGLVLGKPYLSGVFHLGGIERITRLELGRRTAKALGLDPGLVQSARRAGHPGAPRPRDVSLSIWKAREILGWMPRPLDVALLGGRPGL